MSLHASVVMVRADVRSEMADVFRDFDYAPVTSERVNGWNATLAALEYPRPGASRDHVYKAVALHNGWTVILDPALMMATEEDACTRFATRTRAPLFTMICEGVSGTYSFSLFDPAIVRAYMSVDGKVDDDRGSGLPEEHGIDLAKLFEDDVLRIMERLGVSYLALESVPAFDVWTLDESHIAADLERRAPSPAAKRPWWKIW